MTGKTKWIVVGAFAVAVAGVGGALAGAAAGDDRETPITGTAYDKATAAALAHTGGGRVTGTEAGDEDAYYEVEVTLPSGDEVDVALDRGFKVVGSETDRESPSDHD